MSRPHRWKAGTRWFTDGVNNTMCQPGQQPAGFRPGVTTRIADSDIERRRRQMRNYNLRSKK